MKYYMPTRVFDEKDCVLSHAEDLADYGEHALIVTGRHSAKACGASDDVIQALGENGQAYSIFSEVEENPSVETIMKASAFGREEKVDFVIGIGGGSPLDAAKAIAFILFREDGKAEDLYDKNLPADALDVIAVPTTCGTGSEVTGVSVLTVHEKKTKMSIPARIFPKLALIDGKYLKSAPISMIVNTAVDAFAHMAESYLSVKADDYSKAAAISGLAIWKDIRDVKKKKKEADDEDRAKLMRASTFAGIAIAQTGTSIPHALSYILTYDQKIPHGKACGYFLAEFIANAAKEDQDAILKTAGFEGIEDFRVFMDKAFGKIEVPEETLKRAWENVSSNPVRMKSARMDVTPEKLLEITGLTNE